MKTITTKKKVKYQISKRKFMEVEVENEKEELSVIILNRMFYSQTDKDDRFNEKTISYEWLEENGFPFTSDSLQESISKTMIRQIIKQAVKALSKKQKIVIYYLFYKNYSLEETAKLLNTSIQNVNQIKNRTLKVLKKMLVDKYDFNHLVPY